MSTMLHVTLDQYEAMVLRGAFDTLRNKRIELIHGELREMSPQGPPHSQAIVFFTRWSSTLAATGKIDLRIQCPIRIPNLDSEPEPDIVWALPATEADRHTEPHEVQLLIEVADSTRAFDLGEKAALYAAAGIEDYWVVDLPNRLVHVLRGPSPQGYQQQQRVAIGGTISPLHFPALSLAIADLFPRP